MPSADPTMHLLERLKDPSQWAAVKVGVPICTPLRKAIKAKDGTERLVEVTEADLPMLAAKARHMFDAYGVPLRITAGHVIAGLGVAELEQAPLVGYAINPRVGTFGQHGLPCILADEYYEHATFAKARGLPYRSPEYLVNQKEIRGVALLIQDPFLNMGMVTCGFDSPMLCCALSNEAVMPDPAVTTPAVQTVSPQDFEALRMQLDQEKVNFARVETELRTEIKSVRDENATLRRERDREKCERLVIQLEAEGFQLVRGDEVDELLGRDEASRAKYIERLKKCYRKGDPTTHPIPFSLDGTVPIGDGPGTKPPKPEDRIATAAETSRAVLYCQEHTDVKYEKAVLMAKKGEI